MVLPVALTAAFAAMTPAVKAALIGATGAGITGLAGASGSKATAKAMKESAKIQAKETKRRTLAELMNSAFNREFEAGENMRKRGGESAGQRASVLQNIASQYV